MSRSTLLFSALVLGALAGCGGGGGGSTATPTPTVATSLVYANPTTGGYQLVKNAALSTATHLVLDLTGPSGTQARGLAVGLTFTVAGRAGWAPVTPGGANLVQEGGVFTLGAAPRALVGRTVNNGIDLEVGLFQKGAAGSAATLGTAPLASVAMDLKAGATPGAITLAGVPAKCFVQDATGARVAITPVVGSLSAQ